MNYVTSIYLISEEWDGSPKDYLHRFVGRGLAKIHHGIPFYVPALERSQAILGNSMLFILDSNLKRHPNGEILYGALSKAKLNVKEVALPPRGIYSSKWACMLHSFASRPGPTIWMDGTDAEVAEKLSDEEDEFLSEKAKTAGIVAEWVSGVRCMGGIRPTNSDGTMGHKNPTQVQMSIYCLPAGSIAETCYKMDIDDDQIAVTCHLQKEKGWYQDVINADTVKATTSSGLFRVHPPEIEHMLAFRQPHRFKPKIIHKPTWWHKSYQ